MFISDQPLHSKRSELRSFLDLEKTIQQKMSGDKSANPCNKFQANIFNKSKCQNCFKSRELHLLTDNDMDQAKPIYGGWLCLAPEGTDFDNPMQRSRKWQRRFFILYEHGSLSFALDELRSTLPQGTVNMNLCTEVIDAEPKTGQRNALCIITPEQQFFIRGETKEIINGWSEQLVAYPRTNKQNQKKKRKVEPTNSQEPCPAKMAATEPSFPAMESAAHPRSSPWQEELPGGGPDVAPVWSLADSDLMGSDETPAGNVPHYLPPASKDPLTFDGSLPSSGSCISSSVSSLDSVASSDDYDTGSNSQPVEPMPYRVHASPNSNCQRAGRHHNETERLMGLELMKSGRTNVGQEMGLAVSRKGRTEARSNFREKLKSCGNIDQLTAPLTQRRAKSLDRRTTESIMTPDLLNFKKGWMVKLDKEDQWKKYWFVLSADNLRYYKDSIAEEASDLEGEIDLTMCYNVSEYQVQRNYGFQIHTQKCVYTLSAMTAGIRRNWIQALMKNVHPSNAPDVAILPGLHIPCSPPEALPKPDVTQDPSSEVPAERVLGTKQSRVRERRREGRSRTFDWAEFRPAPPLASEPGPQETTEPVQPELGDVERKRRREERRKRYESMLGLDYGRGEASASASAKPSPRAQQRVQEEIEQCWQQVERTAFRQERTVPLYTESQSKDTAEIERLLETYRKGVEELKAQLVESDLRRLELEVQLNTAQGYKEQALNNCVPPPLDTTSRPESDFGPLRIDQKPFSCHTQSLADTYRETRELLLQQEMIRHSMQEQLSLSSPVSSPQECSPESQTPSIWLQDAEGNLRELELGVFPGSHLAVSTSVVSPASVVEPSYVSLNQNGVENRASNLGSETNYQQTPSPESHTKRDAWSPDALSMEETGERANHLTKDIQNGFETLKHTEEQAGPDKAKVSRLSQEVELLTNQNKALNQRNQEMLNQLTEADREIERLKAELVGQTQHSHLPEVEQLSQAKAECLERELRRREQQHQEAQSLLASLDQRLRDTETQLQLREATLKGLGFQTEEEVGKEIIDTDTHNDGLKKQEYLHQCLQTMEAKMLELERQLQDHNTELREAERLHNQRAAEAEADIRRLKEEVQIKRERTLEKERIMKYRSEEKWQDGDISVSGEERIQEVVEAIMMRSKALGKVLEVIDVSDMNIMNISLDREREDVEVDQTVLQQLQVEEEFWRTLLNSLKANPSQSPEDKLTDNLLSEVVEHMVMEKQILRLAHSLFSQGKTDSNTDTGNGGLHRMHGCRSLKDLDIIGNTVVETVSEIKETSNDDKRIMTLFNRNNGPGDIISRHFNKTTQEKMFLFNQIALSVRASANEELQSMAERLCHISSIKYPWVASIHCTAMEALSSYRISRLNNQHKRELQDTKQGLSTSLLMCSNCSILMNENTELRARLSDLERQLSATVDMATVNQGEHMDSSTEPLDTDKQKTETTAVNVARKMEMEKPKQEVTALEEVCMFGTKKEEEVKVVESDSLTNSPESPMVDDESESGSQKEAFYENVEKRTNNELQEEPNPLGESEAETVSLLRNRVKDLEEQLSVMAEKMTQEHDGKMLSLQLKHKKDMEKLKAIYEHGFTTMEESHEKVLGELQHRHQLDLERLQRDSNRLLEEETAATITAIEAMKNAHRMELEREIQRACQASNNAGSVDLEEICMQHSEELASCQRELEVLSQQYSLKCLECAHLAQALEAERQALCQCQQENQDLRTRNQEVSGHLAAEITRLCSLAKQDAFPLSQERDVYELEITLRVKDSEVQYLKQEITSLKDELQTAQKEKRFATEKYKDIYTELSIMRAKAERDIGQLRENLRLAHNALEECSPLDTDNDYQRGPCC